MESLLKPLIAALLGVGAAVAPQAAGAHALDSSLERVAGLNRTLELQSRFSTGQPASGAQVSLVAPDGRSLALGMTDADGQLRFAVPAAADARWEVRVDQGPGHRDYLELPLEGAAAPAPQLGRSLQRSGVLTGGGAALLLGVWMVGRRRRGG